MTVAMATAAGAAAALAASAGLLLALSPGRARPFVDARGRPLPGSISEKVFLDIGGVRQGMFIKGRSRSNPVLLYLHGGIPDIFLTQQHPTGLEDLFVVASWDRRGAGLSFNSGDPAASLTLQQFVADTIEVADYLRARFGQSQIYLMAHSGGTFIGIQAVASAPDLFRAYIGVGQMASQLESEILAYRYMLERFRRLGDRRMVDRLASAPVTASGGTPRAYLGVRDAAMHRLGIGTMHDMRSIITGLILPSLAFREYTIAEKIQLWRAKAASGVTPLWDEMLATDLAATVPELTVPAYFLHGIHDYTCAYPVARDFVRTLRAPVKGFYTFDRSAHSPMFEEPDRLRDIVCADVLRGSTSLADADNG